MFMEDDFPSRIVPAIVRTVMMGCAGGKMNSVAVPEACRLLQRTLQFCDHTNHHNHNNHYHPNDWTVLLAEGMTDYLELGEPVQRTIVSMCGKCVRNVVPLDAFISMMMGVWELQQSDNVEALIGSDAVQRLVRQYRE
jgi:hypothetical protein